jgi:hypothetical protein
MEAGGGFGNGLSWETPAWAVRIRRTDGTIAGAGVLVSPECVLTCTGVVTRGERVTAEFIGVPGQPQAGATEDTPGPGGTGLALLRLVRPGPAGAVSPLHRRSVPRREVRMYGFPVVDGDGESGAWLRAATAPGGDSPDGRVRLTAREQVPPGFGGAGVADLATGELLGMAHTAPTSDTDPRVSMSPAETIVRHLPQAAAWTLGRPAVDEPLSDRGAAEPRSFDLDFATRLAEWFRGDVSGGGRPHDPDGGRVSGRRHGDGRQVKISLVPTGDAMRAGTLRRAIVLADRELRPITSDGAAEGGDLPQPPAPFPPYPPAPARPETVPPSGGHDLAVDGTGRSTQWIAERVAERLGPGRGLPAAERIGAARLTLTLVVVGVDEAAEPGALLDLLALLRKHGDRMLLVFRTNGAHYAQAQSQLVIEPGQQRQARLAEQLAEVTGPLATALHEKTARVRADTEGAVDALIRAHAVQAELAGTNGVIAALGQDPDVGRYERVVGRSAARLRETIARLDGLLDRRAELLGRLTSYHALYQGASDSEDLEAESLYLAAYERLHARPCDVAAVESEVSGYIEFIERWGRRRSREGGDPPL